MPDAIGFATRTTVSLLLAYFASFAIQLDTASSAGLCVAIVAQPTPGAAMSKAIYRTLGTVLGGIGAVALTAAFPQDRTMLLLGFTLVLAACTFIAALLRDFRSYGAVLCGYTVGIIAVSSIDTPDGAFLAALNRVAAILLGIGSVAVVNLLLSGVSAFADLLAALRQRMAAAEALALSALTGNALPTEPLPAQIGAAILALRTEAGYAAREMPDGKTRRAGATATIAALLGMLSATRAIATGLRQPVDDATRQVMAEAADQLRGVSPRTPLPSIPATPLAAALLDRANELLSQHDIAKDGLHALATGDGQAVRVDLPFHYDVLGAAISAARTIIAVAGGCLFCIYAGWPGATQLLVQQAAFTALLGMSPNPSAAAVGIAAGLPFAALAAGVVGFLVFPQAAGFVPFALALTPLVFAGAMASRHPVTSRYGPGFLLYFTLLLAPANTQSFDLASFFNTLLTQVVAVVFMLLAFRFVLPVSRGRRLLRMAMAIVRQLRRSMEGELPRHGAISERCLRFDRLAQAQIWLGRPTPVRIAILERLSAFSELESALRRAWAGMRALGRAMPPRTPDALEAASQELLASSQPPSAETIQAAAGLYGAAVLLRTHRHALRRYGVVTD